MFVYMHGRFNDARCLPPAQRYFFLCKFIRNGRYFRNIQVLLHFFLCLSSYWLCRSFVGPETDLSCEENGSLFFFARSSHYVRAGSHPITQTSGQKVTAIASSCICMRQPVKFHRSCQLVYLSRKSKCRHREDLPIGMLPI